MIANALKLILDGVLLLVTAGGFPNPRYGAAIALGICILAAIALHFAAP